MIFMIGEFFASRFFIQSISNNLYIRKKTKHELTHDLARSNYNPSIEKMMSPIKTSSINFKNINENRSIIQTNNTVNMSNQKLISTSEFNLDSTSNINSQLDIKNLLKTNPNKYLDNINQ